MLFLAPLLLRGKLAFLGLPRWLSGKESACQCRRHRFDPWVGRIPWRRKWQPTPVFLLGKFHGQRGAWWGPWGSKELDMTEPVSTGFSLDVFLRFITFSYFSHLWPCFPDYHSVSQRPVHFLEEEDPGWPPWPSSPSPSGILESPDMLCPGGSEHRLVFLLLSNTLMLLWFRTFTSPLKLRVR